MEPAKDPNPLLAKPTVPVGGMGVAVDVSVTTAVQVVAWFTGTVDGVQETVVVVV